MTAEDNARALLARTCTEHGDFSGGRDVAAGNRDMDTMIRADVAIAAVTAAQTDHVGEANKMIPRRQVWPAGVMTRDSALHVLVAHNAWRRGAAGQPTDPRILGKALDAVIAALSVADHIPELGNMVASPLAVQIADAAVRSDVECFAAIEGIDDELERTVYDTSRVINGVTVHPDAFDSELAVVQRALRYIGERAESLPFLMHRDAEQPHLVWFEDRPASAPLSDRARMDAEYEQAASRG